MLCLYVQSVYSIAFYMNKSKAEIVHEHPNAATCVEGFCLFVVLKKTTNKQKTFLNQCTLKMYTLM